MEIINYWAHFARLVGWNNLLPIARAQDGYETRLPQLGKIPSVIIDKKKRIVGFNDWQSGPAKESQVRAWARDGRYNLGVLLGRELPGGGVAVCIDADTDDEAHQETLYQLLRTALKVDRLSYRMRSNSNRRAYVLRITGAKEPIYKRTFGLGIDAETDKPKAIEILALGQQFAALGVHPSGAALEWIDNEFSGVPVLPDWDQLTLTQDEWEALQAAIIESLPVVSDAVEKGRTRALVSPGDFPADSLALFLDDEGWTLNIGAEGQRHIRSPFADLYSGESGWEGDTSVTYFLPGTRNYANGTFVSKHATDANRTQLEWQQAIGFIESEFEAYPPLVPAPVSGTPEKAFLGWDEIDVTNPPGFTGDICRQMLRTAYRPLPLSYVAAALELIATAMGLGKRRTLGGGKPALISFVIAETGSGKETGQQFARDVLISIGRGRHLAGDVRSDKDLVLGVYYSGGTCLYTIDEAHSLIDTVQDKHAAAYHRQLASLMLTMATANVYVLSNNHRRGLKTEIDAAAKLINADRKQLKARIDNEELHALEIKEIEAEITQRAQENQTQRNWVESGIPFPIANFLLSSTPRNFERAITNAEIDSGLLGRSMLFHIGEGRNKLQSERVNFSAGDPGIRAVINSIQRITKPEDAPAWVVEPDAAALMDQISDYLEDDEQLNASIVGGLYSRGMERINLLVSILAAHDGVITAAYVRWAFAAFMSSVDTIRRLARMNNIVGTDQKIMMAILDKLKRGKIAHSLLKQAIKRKGEFAEAEEAYLTRTGESLIDKLIAQLVSSGRIIAVGRNSYALS